uniref:Uncharacterized protein n=1 Tax=Myotis myotis TaxID=51298 RepID=A0A7J7V3R5_MYOMY|nr:hypothetical protein mMyoMyo1_008463 [Myotis myotis]
MPGLRPPCRYQTSIPIPRTPLRAQISTEAPRLPFKISDSHPVPIPTSGHRYAWQDSDLHPASRLHSEPKPPNGTQTSIRGKDLPPVLRPPSQDLYLHQGPRPTSGSLTFMPGPRPQTQFSVPYRGPDIHSSPDHPFLTQRSSP